MEHIFVLGQTLLVNKTPLTDIAGHLLPEDTRQLGQGGLRAPGFQTGG